MANSIRQVQERARRSSIAGESEEERSIKDLFTQRIVKGRPDLFVASTPAPTTPITPESAVQRLEVLQSNITGFVFLHFCLDSSSASSPSSRARSRLLKRKATGPSVFVISPSALAAVIHSRRVRHSLA